MEKMTVLKKLTILLGLLLWINSKAFIFVEKYETIRGEVNSSYGVMEYEIHFKEGEQDYALRVNEILQNSSKKLINYFQYAPKDLTHFTIESEDTSANGSATVFPKNHIVLNTYPPKGNEYLVNKADWVEGLVLHELVHIIHMDYTSGFPGIVNKIFGSFGKWNGVVPRWFAEGIATWAESEFTEGGRLRSDLLDMDFNWLILKGEVCSTVDCLDDPGVYPHRSYPYWIGAKFFKWLEGEKNGTIACLIKSNSNSVPGFLNEAFEECTGQSAAILFIDFMADLRISLTNDQKRSNRELDQNEIFTTSIPAKGNLRAQKGIELLGQKLIYFSEDERLNYINTFDFSNLKHNLEKFDYIPSYLATPARANELDGSLLMSYGTYHYYTSSRKWGKIFASGLNKVEKLDFEKPYDYLFTKDQKYFGLYFEGLKWILSRATEDGDETIREFSNLEDIQFPMISQGKLLFKSVVAKNGQSIFSLKSVNLESGAEKVLFSTPNAFSVAGHCKDIAFLKIDEQTLVGIDSEGSSYQFKNELVRKASLIKGNEYITVFGFKENPGTISYLKKSCMELLDPIEGTLERLNKPVAEKENKKVEHDFNFYPHYSHFKPGYWFFSGSSGDNVDVFTIFTSLGDPNKLLSMDLQYSYYSGVNKSAPSITVNSEDFLHLDWTVNYSKSYSKSLVDNSNEVQERKIAAFGKDFDLGPITFVPAIGGGTILEDDFISRRETDQIFAKSVIYHSPYLYDQFLQFTYLQTRIFNLAPKGAHSFWGGEGKFNSRLRIFDGLDLNVNTTWGKLSKNGFSQGVIYAGGASSMSGSSFHEFYGINRRAAFGNNIFTGRLEAEILALEVYSTSGLFPVYLKDLRILAGWNYIEADRIFFNSSFLRNKHLSSYHVGAKARVDLLYRISVDVSMIGAHVVNSYGNNDSKFMLLVDGSIPGL